MLCAALLFLGAAFSLALAITAERRRGVPGRRTFAVLLAAIALWLLAYGLEFVAADRASKLLWSRVQYFGIVAAVLAWFRFALQYAGHGAWLTRRRQTLVLLIPILTLVLVWTNDWHGLIWQEIQLIPSPLPTILAVRHGSWFWVWLIFAYALILAGCVALLRTLGRTTPLHRRQGAALLLAVMPPWLANIAYVLELGPAREVDPTPFALLFSGLALAWNLSQRRFLAFFPGLIPIARDAIVESMRDGVVLLDSQNRVVDLNPAAATLLERSPGELLGQPFDRLGLPLTLEDISQTAFDGATSRRLEITLGPNSARRHYDVGISPVRHYRRHDIGRLLVFHDVTERKQTLKTLRQREAELLMALEAGRLGIWEWHVPTGKIAWSRVLAGARRMDVEQHTIDLRHLIPSVHPGDQEQVSRALARATAEGSTYHLEFRLLRPGGGVRWIEARGRALSDGAGRTVRVNGVYADATDRKRAEAALAESEERLRLALAAAGMATWDHDLATDTLVWSDEAAALLGQASADCASTLRTLLRLVHPADRAALEQAITARLAGDSEGTAEFRIVRPDGTVRWLASRGRVFRSADGRPTRVLGTLMDVTERKTMEETLRASEARFRSLAEYAPIGILQVDRAGACTYANPSWGTLSGTSPSASLGQGWLQAIAPRDRSTLRQELSRAIREGGRFEREVRILATDGLRWARFFLAPMLGDQGDVLGGVVTVTDTTPTKRLEEQRKLLLLLEERERIAMDLHDGIIQSLYAVALRLASQERSLPDAHADAAAVLRQSRREVDAVIREARAYIEALRPRHSGGPNLQDGLRLLVERLQGATALQVELQIDDEAARRLDGETAAHALYVAREAIANVMRHARARLVTIRLARESDGVLLAVDDDGVGFDDARIDRRGGDGLRNMEERAALIGACLEIRSRPGSGAHVRLLLSAREA